MRAEALRPLPAVACERARPSTSWETIRNWVPRRHASGSQMLEVDFRTYLEDPFPKG